MTEGDGAGSRSALLHAGHRGDELEPEDLLDVFFLTSRHAAGFMSCLGNLDISRTQEVQQLPSLHRK